MKNIFVLPVVLCFVLAACNNTSSPDDTVSTPADDSVKIMKDVIARYPDSLLLVENLVQYYRDKGNYDMAISTTNDVIRRDSANTRFWDIKAILHAENGDTAAAISSYEILVNMLPDAVYVLSLSELYAKTKNPQALVLADALIKGKSAHAEKEANFIKGIYYSYSGDNQKAIEYFDKCLALDYTYMLAYREKGIALYNLGKYEEALTVMNKAITLQNNFDEGYYWMGRCLEKMGRKDEAIESYRTALKYDPDYVEAKTALQQLGAK